MSIITFPESLGVASMSWAQQRRDMYFNSSFGSQAVEVSPPVWVVSLDASGMRETSAGAWQALLMNLRGQTNQLELWNMGRPQPLGSMRGTMLLTSAAAQGDTVLAISASGQAGTTLVQGDMIGVGTGLTQQVVMVVVGGTADGSGNISVTVEPPLRNAHLISAAVTWDKPKALFRRVQSDARWEYGNKAVSGISLDLVEDTRS